MNIIRTATLLSTVLLIGTTHAAETLEKPEQPLTPATVNDAAPSNDWKPGDFSPGALRTQILLDRARFSPGEIDGMVGSNMQRAILGFQAAHDLPTSGKIDDATWSALDQDHAKALVTVTLTDDDVAGPFRPLPSGMAAQARLDALGYTSPLEELGERFHASPDLLKKLNPDADFSRAGTTLVVPNLEGIAPLPEISKVVVAKAASTVSLLDDDGHVAAQYPASTGSRHDPLPIGQWKIKGVGRNPTFHYNPKLFWDAKPGDSKATLPPGPNNPVGVVWIDLSKDHYGIHGTPEPSRIGKTQSHGCIRMTNWSAKTVSDAVRPGMTALLEK